jgi:integrase
MRLYKQKKKSKYWYYEFQFNGKTYRKSTRTTSKKLAGDIARAARRKLEESFGGYKQPEAPRLFSAAAEEYLKAHKRKVAPTTLGITARAIKHLSPFFRNKYLIDITMDDIDRFIEAMQKKGVTPRGINMKLATLRAILRRNHCWEALRPDFSMLDQPQNQGKALAASEDARVKTACRNSISRVLYPAWALARHAAMRRDEIRLLKWGQIDLNNAVLTVGASKTVHGEGRVIPLVGPALEALRDWASKFPNRLPDHCVFPRERYAFNTKKGAVIYKQDPTKPIKSWRSAWVAARKRAQVRVRFHDLRHTCITRWLESGMTIQMIARIVGWSSSTMNEMSKRYGHFSVEALRAAMTRGPIGQDAVDAQEDVAPRTSNTRGARKPTISKKEVASENATPKRGKKTA